MKSFLKLLILVPLALILVAFAVANRQGVTVSFDPFATDVPAFALSGPLFAVIIIVIVTGVVIGGVATWLGQGRYRRTARLARRESDNLRAETDRLRAETDRLRLEVEHLKADLQTHQMATADVEPGRHLALPGHAA